MVSLWFSLDYLLSSTDYHSIVMTWKSDKNQFPNSNFITLYQEVMTQ